MNKFVTALKDLFVFTMTVLVKEHIRAAQGVGLTILFIVAVTRFIDGSGNLFELFCAWLTGFIYVRFLNYVAPKNALPQEIYVETEGSVIQPKTEAAGLLYRLAGKIKNNDQRIDYGLSIIWPAVMLWVAYLIYVEQENIDVSDLQR